jgi:hypothetical protein
MPEEILTQFCYKCKTEKLPSEFYAFRPSRCKVCVLAYNRKYKVENFQKVREWKRFSAQRFYQSGKGKLYQEQYRRSHKGKEIQKKYRQKKKTFASQKNPPPELICTRCRIQKPSSEFPKNLYHASGFSSWCKPCHRKHVITKGKDARKKASRKYALKMRKYPSLGPRSKASQASHDYRQKYKADPSNRLKILARLAVNNAVIAGKLLKPKICPLCGLEKRITGHHWSYLRNHWLDVKWVCYGCHEAIHHPIISDLSCE